MSRKDNGHSPPSHIPNPEDIVDHDHRRGPDLSAVSADEYKQKRRLQRILDAQDLVEDVGNASLDMFVNGEIQQEARNILLLQAVKQYIRECYNLLVDYARDLDRERDLYWYGTPDRPLGRIEFDHRDDVVFLGLRDLLDADWFYSETWTTTEQPRNRPEREEDHEQHYVIPRSVIYEGYLRLKRFTHEECDLDIAFETVEKDAKADPF